jgi:PAS domain S-box-containing protein
LFLSAQAETEDKLRAFAAGGQDYITKPFVPAEVLARVHTHLRLSRMEHHLQAEVRQALAERASAYEALRQSEFLFHSQFDYGNIGIAITTPSMQWQRVNRKLTEMLDYSETELQGLSWAAVTHPADLAADQVQFGRLLAGDLDAYELDKRFIRKDGAVIFTHLTVAAFRNLDHSLSFVITSVLDITERRQAEALQLQMEVLRQVNQVRSQLIANVSHEIRTPLGLIMGMANVLQQAEAPLSEGERQDFLRDIEQEARRLQAIVESLLDAERLQAGRDILKLQPTDVRQVIDRAARAMTRQAAQHQIVQVVCSEPLMAVVDANRLEQVLHNLLDNAVKYAPAGTSITVCGEAAAGQVRLSVGDQGPGIPSAEQERVFDRFYRIAEQNASTIPGLGLGLPICRGIVEMHGGKIWVESEGMPGKGSRFILTLPAQAGQTGERRYE